MASTLSTGSSPGSGGAEGLRTTPYALLLAAAAAPGATAAATSSASASLSTVNTGDRAVHARDHGAVVAQGVGHHVQTLAA